MVENTDACPILSAIHNIVAIGEGMQINDAARHEIANNILNDVCIFFCFGRSIEA